MRSGDIRICPTYGRQYTVHQMSVLDQSECSGCRVARVEAASQPDTDEQKSRRDRAIRGEKR